MYGKPTSTLTHRGVTRNVANFGSRLAVGWHIFTSRLPEEAFPSYMGGGYCFPYWRGGAEGGGIVSRSKLNDPSHFNNQLRSIHSTPKKNLPRTIRTEQHSCSNMPNAFVPNVFIQNRPRGHMWPYADLLRHCDVWIAPNEN